MHERCPNCNMDFRQEPGFYVGAMYMSYGINIALMIIFGITYEIVFNPIEIRETVLSVLIPPIILAPWIYRISRSFNLYVFGRR